MDPSSRRTGGALLGDRIRVRSGSGDPGVFIRSMAARSRLGGVAEGTRASVDILAAAFDRVFVETVGVGQSEVEVADLVDTLVYVANPESGDALQFMKAGILELPDVFAVNKSDLGASAQRTASELESGLALGERPAGGVPPRVVAVSARDGAGIEELVRAVDAHRDELLESGALRERRERSRCAFVIESLERRYGSYGIDRLGGAAALRARISEGGGASAYGRVAELSREIEDALRKPPATST